MNNERLEQLLKFYDDDPNDPFNLYCLANEYKNHDPEKALNHYIKLLKDHPNYLPTYYHAAELYIDNDEIDLAEKIIDDGIELALKLDDSLALRELRNKLDDLLDY